MRMVTAVLTGALVLAPLTACSGGTGSYCDDLDIAAEEFQDFDAVEPAQLPGFFDTMQDLSESAPDEVGDAWQTVGGRIEDFQESVQGAGLSVEDLTDADSFDLSDLDAAARQQLQQAAAALDTPDYQAALEEIRTHAQTECDIEFGPAGQ